MDKALYTTHVAPSTVISYLIECSCQCLPNKIYIFETACEIILIHKQINICLYFYLPSKGTILKGRQLETPINIDVLNIKKIKKA